MDRHLAALLEGLSFKHLYRSTAKTVNVLNTVADSNRQTLQVLPPNQQSVNIPFHQPRRSKNKRLRLSGQSNPLYDRNFSSQMPLPRIPPFANSGTEQADENPSRPRPSPASQSPHVDSPQAGTQDGTRQQESSGRNVPEPPIQASSQDDGPRSSARTGSRRPATRTRQSPEDLLASYLSELDPNTIYSIPGASSSQSSADQTFDVENLQRTGLLNDGNVCSLISLILSLHRICIKDHLIDPDICVNLNSSPDFPSCVFMKIMSALPSQIPFSVQLFIESWNDSGRNPRIHPGFSDVAALAEGLLSNLQLKQYSSRPPVFSQFLGSFKCRRCGKDHVRVTNWEMQIQSVIPLLQLPPNTNQEVDVSELLGDYIAEPFETRCSDPTCKNRIMDAALETQTGCYTILAVNRFDILNPN